MAAQGAAPAGGIRNPAPGTLRVTVRPYYEGPPLGGWTWQGERGEIFAIGALIKPARVAEVTVPKREKPRWRAERRHVSANGHAYLRNGCAAWRAVPLALRGRKARGRTPRRHNNRGSEAMEFFQRDECRDWSM